MKVLRTLLFMALFVYGLSWSFPYAESYFHVESPLPAQDGFLMQLLGESRSVFSSMLILQADRYYHGGVGHPFFEKEQGMFFECDHEDHEPHHCGHHDDGIPDRPGSFLADLAGQLQITKHVHLHRSEIHEIMPWFRYAIQVDPYNELAYMLTSYVLIGRLDDLDKGMQILQDGVARNPDSWKLKADLGRLYLVKLEEPEKAVTILLDACALIAGDMDVHEFDYIGLFSLTAHAKEAAGDIRGAIETFKYLESKFPERRSVKLNLERLRERASS